MKTLIKLTVVSVIGFTVGATVTLYAVREAMEEKGLDFDEFMSKEESK